MICTNCRSNIFTRNIKSEKYVTNKGTPRIRSTGFCMFCGNTDIKTYQDRGKE